MSAESPSGLVQVFPPGTVLVLQNTDDSGAGRVLKTRRPPYLVPTFMQVIHVIGRRLAARRGNQAPPGQNPPERNRAGRFAPHVGSRGLVRPGLEPAAEPSGADRPGRSAVSDRGAHFVYPGPGRESTGRRVRPSSCRQAGCGRSATPCGGARPPAREVRPNPDSTPTARLTPTPTPRLTPTPRPRPTRPPTPTPRPTATPRPTPTPTMRSTPTPTPGWAGDERSSG